MKGAVSQCLDSDNQSIEGLRDYAVALASLLAEKRTRLQQLSGLTTQIQKGIRHSSKLKALAQQELRTALAKSSECSWNSEGYAALQTTHERLETLLVHSKIRLAHLKSEQESLEDAITEMKSAVASKDLDIVRTLEKIDKVKNDEQQLSNRWSLPKASFQSDPEKCSFSKRDIKPCSIVQFPFAFGMDSARSIAGFSLADNPSTTSLHSSSLNGARWAEEGESSVTDQLVDLIGLSRVLGLLWFLH